MRRWTMAVWVGACGLLWPAPEVWSGPSMAVCKKARRADLVVELKFTVSGRYPPSYLRRRWCPKFNRRTLASAKVVSVLKGKVPAKAKLGRTLKDIFVSGWPECRQWWQKMYSLRTFTRFVFLKRKGRGWRMIGGTEEHFSCIGKPEFPWRPRKASQCKGICIGVSHTSFCPFHKLFKAKVKRCLQGKRRRARPRRRRAR